ncbi:histidine kinase [Dechloromonas denitrificans]|uniref:C4-dicarboxylate transport sensor protein DctB n=1 Tax=Dechloromonas denitrificans TaxID=281362 RepID=A0A133XIC7_9RHOO|nr:ATP-binding protein [Dechloromonas denitrificans]KXB30697.1 histidine kinase [Dechloromonas denitrificans]
MNPNQAPNPAGRKRRTLLLLGAAICFCLLLGWLSYRVFFGIYLSNERHLSAQRLDAFARSLEATLARHESLPGLLALDPALAALLREPANPQRIAAANAYLEAAQQGAAVAVTFLIDAQGMTLAASNWRLPRSFVGHNYAFRPYFRDALRDGLGRFYGVGVTTGEPGYFLAAPVRDQGEVLGVIVLKVGLESMEQALAGAGDTLLLTDADGVVFLSSDRKLRYRTLAPLGDTVTARLAETRQYGNQAITPLSATAIPTAPSEPQSLALPGEAPRQRLIHTRPVGSLGWQVVQLGDPSEARAAALGAATAVAFAAAFGIGLAAHFRHRARRREELRRVYGELENRIAERTADLTEQIAALESTKAILRETRDAAVQAGKLATLGQMSAGISHELNQPLAALQTFADNASALLARGRHGEVAENLQMISELVERTGRIVRQLKIFARKEAPTPQPVSVASAIEHALMIVEPRRRETAARIAVAPVARDLRLIAEAGRLEQVLVNLLRNGLDAMAGQADALLEVGTRHDGDKVAIEVRDHGPGLPEEVRHHLFEPFYTTKPAGEGLGLGLAISLTIVESYGGTLSAHNAPDGGAVFVLTLPAAGDPDAPSDT